MKLRSIYRNQRHTACSVLTETGFCTLTVPKQFHPICILKADLLQFKAILYLCLGLSRGMLYSGFVCDLFNDVDIITDYEESIASNKMTRSNVFRTGNDVEKSS